MKVDNSGPRFRKGPRTTPLGAPWRFLFDGSAIRSRPLIVVAISAFIASCVAPDTQHHVIISTREQKLAVLDRGNLMAIYPVSTSKFGLGDWPGSSCTPLGELEIAEKIGDHAAPGTVFKDRRPTGEIVQPDSPGRDPIVTRILWLRGREPQNGNAFARTIYIHGTPEERNIGLPVSYGCIRMRSSDIISLYEIVGLGAQVTILDAPLAATIPRLSPTPRLTETSRAGIVIR
jgi:lipoprotein-anchoring transpeptidase ErfK/SrfK